MTTSAAIGDDYRGKWHEPYNRQQWQCHKCGQYHSWNGGCVPAPSLPIPQPSVPAPSVAKKPKPVTDVVRADKDKITSKDRCNLCSKGFKRSDAVIRVRDLQKFSEPGTLFHRRCMEGLLEVSVDDEPKDKKKFDEYRDQIADKYGIEAQDD